MSYICPYCKNTIKQGVYCSVCLRKIDQIRKIWDKSSFYYNQGLKAAQNRELSLAHAYLQKAITLYKYNIDARNLLGLVYLETGQTGEALKEWIVSSSFQKEDNIASYYIEQIKNEPKYLSTCKEALMLYNKALSYLHQGDTDMAMIRLKKVVSMHPSLVQAKVLLSLIYIEEKQYNKAFEQVKKALEIDKSHKIALSYLRELSQKDTQSKEPYEIDYTREPKLKANFENIMNRQTNSKKSIIYFFIGAVAMAIVGICLVLPSRVKNYQNQIVQLQESKESLSTQVQSLSEEYEVKLADLENHNKELQTKVTGYEEEMNGYKQKESLETAQELVDQGEYVEAAKTLYAVATTYLDEENLEKIDKLKESVYPRAADYLYNEGLGLYNSQSYTEAAVDFETLLQYEPGEWTARKSLYYLADIYEQTNNIEGAKKYYTKVITEYPDTRESYKAQERLEELDGNNLAKN